MDRNRELFIRILLTTRASVLRERFNLSLLKHFPCYYSGFRGKPITVHTNTRTHTHVHTHIHTHVHTHAHTHARTQTVQEYKLVLKFICKRVCRQTRSSCDKSPEFARPNIGVWTYIIIFISHPCGSNEKPNKVEDQLFPSDYFPPMIDFTVRKRILVETALF